MFAALLTGKAPCFRDGRAYWNPDAVKRVTVHGHIGADVITLASMLRIPGSVHNVSADKIYRPHSWIGFGKGNDEWYAEIVKKIL